MICSGRLLIQLEEGGKSHSDDPCLPSEQVLRPRGPFAPLSPRRHLDLWCAPCYPGISGHCLSFYSLQCFSRTVHLHISLCFVAKSK